MRVAVALLLVSSACGDNLAAPDAKPGRDAIHVDAAIDANLLEPDTLFGTGLCIDQACTQISPDVSTYAPRFTLWADAATKRRWMYLPPGTQIDTTDMDHWVFPMGTKFWKEFTSTDASNNPVRVETRYIVKVGPGNTVSDWFYVAYQWNATQDGTTAQPMGVMNANGTQHDIPSRATCHQCHENLQPTRILGFGAIQLDAPAQNVGDVDLDAAITKGWLTAPPTTNTSPHYPFPSDATAADNAALGYLHANCGHCHNPTSNVYTSTGIHMVVRLTVDALGTLAATPTYMTAVNVAGNPIVAGQDLIVAPGDPDHSILIYRFESTNSAIHMPAVATEVTDPTGDATLRTWITAIP